MLTCHGLKFLYDWSVGRTTINSYFRHGVGDDVMERPFEFIIGMDISSCYWTIGGIRLGDYLVTHLLVKEGCGVGGGCLSHLFVIVD